MVPPLNTAEPATKALAPAAASFPATSACLSILQPYQSLAEIFSPIKLGDGSRAMFDAVGNVFAVTELPIADPFGKTFDRLHVAVLVIEDDKAGHPRTLDQDITLDPRTERRRVPASDRSGAADHHPRADRQTSHHGVADRTRGIVEITIDSIGACRCKLFVDGMAHLVVNGNVVPEFVEAAFCLG